MYLKSLQINGFKSFAKKVDLDFKSNISAIVGPNGSGKSNVAEAFRFALGEQSIKNMRGKKGEDLIFSGKTGRLNRAGVKVYFDNKDRGLNIDYDEVKIERVVFRDGVNEYLLNNNRVRAKDIVELLGSANVGSTGHHIISQGEADRILLVNAKERKMMIEDALGLKPFLIRKNESEKKLEKTTENLKEVKIKQRINTPRINFLSKEVAKIEQVKNQKEELKKLYQIFFPQKYKTENRKSELEQKIKIQTEEKIKFLDKISQKRKDLLEVQQGGQNNLQKNERILSLENELKAIVSRKSQQQTELAKYEYELSQIINKKERWEQDNLSSQKNIEIYQNKVNNLLKIIREFYPQESGNLAYKILNYFGIRKDGQRAKDFSEEDLQNLPLKIKAIREDFQSLREQEDILNKKIRILNSDNGNTVQVFGQEIQIEILQLEKQLNNIISNLNILQSQLSNIEREINIFEREEIFAISVFGQENLQNILQYENQNQNQNETEKNILEKIQRIRILLENNQSSIGADSESLIQEYNFLVENQNLVKKEILDLETGQKDLEKVIFEITSEIEERFRTGIAKINKEFSKFFQTLFSGGQAEIFLVKIPIKNKDEENAQQKDKMEEFELGLDLKVSLPNKKITGLSMLSGGERSLISIALLFAMSAINPPPFIILDETDAALDEANSKRYGDMIEKLAEHSQLILITHNRETMSRAGILYGITMDATGVSRLLSVSLEEAEEVAK